MWMHISELHLCWSSQTGKKKVTSCHRIEEMILVLRITFSEKNELSIHDLDTCWNIHALFYKQQEVRLWVLLLWITGPAGWRATAFLMNAGDLCMYAQWDMRSRDALARFQRLTSTLSCSNYRAAEFLLVRSLSLSNCQAHWGEPTMYRRKKLSHLCQIN